MPKCEICGLDFRTNRGFVLHFSLKHESENAEEYYSRYVSKEQTPKCVCGNNCKFANMSIGYLKTCGNYECSRKIAAVSSKRTKLERYGDENYNNPLKTAETCFHRYGVKTNLCTKDNKEKSKNTSLRKYGVDHPFKSKEIQNKQKKTCLERHGYENYRNVVQNKSTKLERYGDENYNNRKKIEQTKFERYEDVNFVNPLKAKKTKLERYGDEKYVNTDKMKQTCLERYGTTCTLTSDIIREKTKNTMLTRYGVDNISKSREFHSNKTRKISLVFDGETIYFDSKAEVEVYKFCKENNIPIKYQPCYFKYTDSFGKEHIYFPDFEINGKLYEVKGGHLWKDDHIWFPYRNTLSEEQLKAIDARDLAKTECMKANNVTIIFDTSIDNLREIF